MYFAIIWDLSKIPSVPGLYTHLEEKNSKKILLQRAQNGPKRLVRAI
jgi:hypothetical protein